MHLPDKDHPIWLLIPMVRVVIRAILLGLFLWLFYNRFDSRDVVTLIFFVLSDGALTGGATAARQAILKQQREEDKKDDSL